MTNRGKKIAPEQTLDSPEEGWERMEIILFMAFFVICFWLDTSYTNEYWRAANGK